MKNFKIFKLAILMLILLLVNTNIASAEVAGINNDNYKDNYKYSVLKMNKVYDIITYNEDGNINIGIYYVPSTVFYIGNGYFVTSAHCVVSLAPKKQNEDNSFNEYYASVVRMKNGVEQEIKSYDLEIVSIDKTKDLAILKTKDDCKDLIPIKLASDFKNQSYKKAFNISYPNKKAITYKEYNVLNNESVLMGDSNFSQTLNNTFKLEGGAIGGQSGSPVINENKEVIGVISCGNDKNSWAVSSEEILYLLSSIDDNNVKYLIPSEFKIE